MRLARRLQPMPPTCRCRQAVFRADLAGVASGDTQAKEWSMRSSPHNRGAALVLSVLGFLAVGARAQDAPVPSGAAASGSATVLFRDVRIFDGMSGRVAGPSDVLVRGNRIERIGAGLVPEPTTRIIVGSGRVLMPGLIDAHWHSMMAAPSLGVILSGDQRHLTLVAGAE